MNAAPETHDVGALLADPSRNKMLELLMSGRAHTAKELAFAADISAQTGSFHLAKLFRASLVVIESQGRHRYYRLADPEVAAAMEAMMTLAGRFPANEKATAALPPIKSARFCYDHLAGRLGVDVLDALLARRILSSRGREFDVTERGKGFLAEWGLDVSAIGQKRRRFACACLDWSERKPHLGGALGCALADHFLKSKWIRRSRESRVVSVTEEGRRAFSSLFRRRENSEV